MLKEPKKGGTVQILRKLDQAFHWLEGVISMLCFVAMALLVLFGVLSRFVLHIPMMWTEEASRYLMVTGAYIGISMAARERAHLGLTFVVDMFPAKIRSAVIILRELISITAYLLFTWFSTSFMLQVQSFQQKSAALRWPMWIMYVPLVVGFGLAAVQAMMLFYNDHFLGGTALESYDDELMAN